MRDSESQVKLKIMFHALFRHFDTQRRQFVYVIRLILLTLVDSAVLRLRNTICRPVQLSSNVIAPKQNNRPAGAGGCNAKHLTPSPSAPANLTLLTFKDDSK